MYQLRKWAVICMCVGGVDGACVPTEEVSGHLYVRWWWCRWCLCTNWGSERSSVCVLVVSMLLVYQLRKWTVICMCVGGVDVACVPTEEVSGHLYVCWGCRCCLCTNWGSERSSVCVLGVSMLPVYQLRKWAVICMCVGDVDVACVPAEGVSGHLYVCWGCQCCLCTNWGFERSSVCLLGMSMLLVYQLREWVVICMCVGDVDVACVPAEGVSGHLYVCWGWCQCCLCTNWGFDRSSVCVLGVSMVLVYQLRKWAVICMCVGDGVDGGACVPTEEVSGHLYVCWGCRCCLCTSWGSEWSSVCVLGMSMLLVYQLREWVVICICVGDGINVACVPTEEVSGHLYVCWGCRWCLCTNWGSELSSVCVLVMVSMVLVYQLRKWAVICMCVGDVDVACVPAEGVSGHLYVCWGCRCCLCTSWGSEWSSVYVLGMVSMLLVYQLRKWAVICMCVGGVDGACVPTEEVSCHLYVCWWWCRWCLCTNWGSERSSVCVLGISMLLVYQLREWVVICMCVGDGVDGACVPTEEVSGHLYVCWWWCRWCLCTNWGSERSSVCVLVMVSMLLVYQLRKWAVICMCVGDGVDVPCVPTEEVSCHLYVCWWCQCCLCTNWGSERSSVCALVMVSKVLVYQLRKWAVICMCVGDGVDGACVPTEEVSGHLYVCWGCRCCLCTSWGSQWSSVCVLVMVSMVLVYQLRKWAVICMCVGDGVDGACVPTEEVSGHLYVCWGYRCCLCTSWGSEWSSICVLVMVSMVLVYQLRKWAVICMCVGDGVDGACVPTEEVSGHLYVCWWWCRCCLCTNWGSERSSVCVLVMVSMFLVYQLRKWAVICMCVGGVNVACVPTEEVSGHLYVCLWWCRCCLCTNWGSERSSVCVLVMVSMLLVYRRRKWAVICMCVGGVNVACVPTEEVSGHLYVCWWCQCCLCTNWGSERSSVCVLGVSMLLVYQLRKWAVICRCVGGVDVACVPTEEVSGHLYVCWGFRCCLCTNWGSERSSVCVLGMSMLLVYQLRKWAVICMCVGGVDVACVPSLVHN